MRLDEAYFITPKGYKLTDEFYDGSLVEKFEVVEEMERQGILFGDYRRYELIIKAILQHSTQRQKNKWVVKGIRKQRPVARLKDEYDMQVALRSRLEDVFNALFRESLPEVNGKHPEYTVFGESQIKEVI